MLSSLRTTTCDALIVPSEVYTHKNVCKKIHVLGKNISLCVTRPDRNGVPSSKA